MYIIGLCKLLFYYHFFLIGSIFTTVKRFISNPLYPPFPLGMRQWRFVFIFLHQSPIVRSLLDFTNLLGRTFGQMYGEVAAGWGRYEVDESLGEPPL